MPDFAEALDRYICEGPVHEPRIVDVRCSVCGTELEAASTADMGTETLEPADCPGCGHADSLAVLP
jgi:DNA-directed RNA polymerase subunit RPC12/RpoP